MGYFTKKASPTGAIVGLLAAGIAIWLVASGQSNSAPNSPNTDVNTTWEQLSTEYGTNEIAFNDRYKSATFYLSGTVARVSDGAGPEVSLFTDNGNSFEADFFYNQSESLKTLTPSDVIEFHCLRFNAGIGVDRCKLDSVKNASG